MPLISVCVFTNRKARLNTTLQSLLQQKLPPQISLEILVISCESDRSFSQVTKSFKKDNLITISYLYENYKNQALAKNNAILNANGEWVIFIHEGDTVGTHWLFSLFDHAIKHHSSIVVASTQEVTPNDSPAWVQQGNFFSYTPPVAEKKPLILHHSHNILLNKSALLSHNLLFSKQHGLQGLDNIDFFNKVAQHGLNISSFSSRESSSSILKKYIHSYQISLTYLMKKSVQQGEYRCSHHVSQQSVFTRFCLSLLSTITISLSIFLLLIVYPFHKNSAIKLLMSSCYKIGELKGLLGISNLATINKQLSYHSQES